jgi:predicted PurR-regulated permease PerM
MSQPFITNLTQQERISYGLMIALLAMVGLLHLAALVIAALFGYFALQCFTIRGRKGLAVALYVLLAVGILVGFYFFAKRAYVTLPGIVEKTIPAVVGWAEQRGLDLPFTDFEDLKAQAMAEVKESFANIARSVRGAVFQIVSLIIGVVMPVSLFLNARWQRDDDPHAVRGSLYSMVSQELAQRVETFYHSFTTVMGAQILISAINSVLTAVFLLSFGYPHVPVLVGLTFICGLLPIVGNLISNTLIIGVSFTMRPEMALFALIFLVTVHKLEYFLNSKIIGHRIKNPMWLTLFGLVIGERLMGIPGMILAPVVLHYIKVEASRSRMAEETASDGSPEKKDEKRFERELKSAEG